MRYDICVNVAWQSSVGSTHVAYKTANISVMKLKDLGVSMS